MCLACRFDFDAMCDLKGNTAVYLLYAHARIASIVRKADRPDVSDGSLAKSASINLQHPAEIALALHLIRCLTSLVHESMPASVQCRHGRMIPCSRLHLG